MAMSALRKGLIRALGGLPLPKALRANGRMVKTVGTGIQWVGNPDLRSMIRLDAAVDPDAEELTRSIALATSAYCYTATMYRAAKVSEPPLYLAQTTQDGGDITVLNHELLPLFSEPSPDYDMVELLARTEIYLLTTGACAWLKVRDMVGRVARLTPFSGDEIRTSAADGFIYGMFELLTSNGNWEPHPREDVVYFKEINPNSWRTNLSKLDVALSQLDLGHQVNRTVRNFMRKAMFPGGVISPHPDWDPDDPEWEAFRNTVEAWYGGPAAAGTPLILQGGATFSRAAIPLKELLPTELLDRIEAVVGSVYGTAPIVLGWKVGLENSPWSQMSEARQSVYEETIIPRWGFFTRVGGRQLLTPEERSAGLKIKFDTDNVAALRADDKMRAEVVSALQNDWTRDERRVYTGQEPLGPDDPRGEEIGSAPTPSSGLSQLSEGQASRAVKLLMDGEPLEWVLFDVNTKAAESEWTLGVQAILDKQLASILRLVDEHIKPAKASGIDPDSTVHFIHSLVEWNKTHGEMQVAEGLYPYVYKTGSKGLTRAAAMTGLTFDVLEPGLALYAKEEAEFLASVMGETTGRKVAAIVQKRLNMGGLIRDLRKDLQESAAFSRSRAQLVARTETTRAWNGAQRRSLSEYERNHDETARVYKTWLSSRDDRVRPEHEVLDDGTKYRIDEPYPNGLMEPSEPNCRCTQTFSLEKIGATASPALTNVGA